MFKRSIKKSIPIFLHVSQKRMFKRQVSCFAMEESKYGLDPAGKNAKKLFFSRDIGCCNRSSISTAMSRRVNGGLAFGAATPSRRGFVTGFVLSPPCYFASSYACRPFFFFLFLLHPIFLFCYFSKITIIAMSLYSLSFLLIYIRKRSICF